MGTARQKAQDVPPAVETRRMNVADLVPAAYNPREIGDDALAGLDASIARFGLVQDIVWNERSGTVVGGHQRLKVLQARGVTEVDVKVVALDETDEVALNIALNSQAITGEFTQDELDALLKEIHDAAPEAYEDLLLDELASQTLFEENGATLEDQVPAAPDEPVSERGAVYTLGRHRLMCGDATNDADVAMLLAGRTPFIMVTDPPYGVDYDPAWRKEARERGTLGLGSPEGTVTTPVEGDQTASWIEAYRLFEGDVVYLWHAGWFVHVAAAELDALDLVRRTYIIWDKGKAPPSRGHYHWRHEPCWYAVRKGRTARWCGDRKQTTMWEVPLLDANAAPEDTLAGHSTQKPVECMARPLRNHGAAGDIVYDPFVGSGTTIIAAQKTGRDCLAIDIVPSNVDIARRRWAEFVHGEGCDWEALTPAVQE